MTTPPSFVDFDALRREVKPGRETDMQFESRPLCRTQIIKQLKEVNGEGFRRMEKYYF
jgi:hypothetical protein